MYNNNYQKNLKLVKYAIALMGLLTLCMVIGIPVYKNFHSRNSNKAIVSQFQNAKPSKEENDTIIKSPHFYGYDDKEKPFTIHAREGYEKHKGIYLLSEVQSDFAMEDMLISLKADEGEINKDNNEIQLEGDVTFVTDNGYSLQSKKANLNIKTKAATGTEEVRLRGNLGAVYADSFIINEGSAQISFESRNRVKTILNN